MAQRGRKNKTNALKDLGGNPGKRKQKNEPTPKPLESTMAPRGRLGPIGRKFWKNYIKQLVTMGIVGQSDLAALEMMSNHYEFAVMAAEKLRDEGLVIMEVSKVDENGNPLVYKFKKHPAAQIFRENAQAFRMFANEFGVTPSARARFDITVDATMEENQNLYANFIEIANRPFDKK
jgi:P27 family predicted phage terminase small subunit